MTNREQISVLKELGQQATGYLLGKTARSVRDSDCPRNADGSYNARDAVAWLLAKLAPATADLTEARTKDTLLKAQLRELDLGERLEELMKRSDHEAVLVAMVLEVKAQMLSLAAGVAPQIAHLEESEIRKELDRRLRRICSDMARGRVSVPSQIAERLEALLHEVAGSAYHSDDGSPNAEPE